MSKSTSAAISRFVSQPLFDKNTVLARDSSWPKISIVTPSFNQGRFLERTILSVLNQNYPNLEYIIMDGGSTDESVAIIRAYESSLAHWESKKDNGQADAVYRGFERSTGEILAYLNSDDLLLPGALERVGRYFRTHPEQEWVTGGTVIVDPDDQPVLNRIRIPMCNLGARATFHQLLFHGCHFNQPASFWRRDVFFATGGFDRSFQFCFDRDLFLRLAHRCASGQIKAFLACFRRHPASKTSTIPEVRNAEREALWAKYGLYRRSKPYRRASVLWHAQRNLIRSRVIQARLLLGLIRFPPPGTRHES